MAFVKNDFSKAIMKRSKLRDNYLKNKTDANSMLYKKQRNYCVSVSRKSKTNYYANLDEKKLSDSKLFWKVMKPSLSDKACVKEQINLVENGEILKTDLETAEILNTFLEIFEDPNLRAILK